MGLEIKKEVEKSKSKIENIFDLQMVPANSWVNINGRKEFKISHFGLDEITLSISGNYVYKNHYDSFFSAGFIELPYFVDDRFNPVPGSLEFPYYIEQFYMNTWKGKKYIKMMRKGGKNAD